MDSVRSAHMRSWRRQVARAVGALGAMLLFLSTAQAAAPATGTFVGRYDTHGEYATFTTPQNKVVTDWAGVLLLQLDKDTLGDRQGPLARMFCIQLFVVVRPGDVYFANGSVTALHGGCYIRYLLAHYPAATVGSQAEGAARQLAIWHFSDDLDLNTVQDPGLRARSLELAAEAQTQVDLNGCPSTSPGIATLTLIPADATVPEGQPVLFTAKIEPPNAAAAVSISVDGTALLDNGQQTATLAFTNGLAYFSMVNYNPGTVTVSAAVPYISDEGTVFDPIGGRQTQRLVLGDGMSLVASARVQTTFQQITPTFTPSATPTSTPATSTPGRGPDITPTTTRPPRKRTPPTETPTAQETPTATFTPPTATELPPPTATPTVTQARRPRRLPNTAAPAHHAAGWLVLAAGLLLAGSALRRRGPRR